jgi:hypothetical protein
MTRRLPAPMPHSPGCPGRSHCRDRTPPCPAYAAENSTRKAAAPWSRRDADCDCCTGTGVPVLRHGPLQLCVRCYRRWQSRGFTGPGPGPERLRAAASATDHYRVLLLRTAAQAAMELRVTTRTVTRWRRLLAAMVEPVRQ